MAVCISVEKADIIRRSYSNPSGHTYYIRPSGFLPWNTEKISITDIIISKERRDISASCIWMQSISITNHFPYTFPHILPPIIVYDSAARAASEMVIYKKKKIKKKRKKTRERLRKKVRKQDVDHAIDQEKSKFKILRFFFYKFQPLEVFYACYKFLKKEWMRLKKKRYWRTKQLFL